MANKEELQNLTQKLAEEFQFGFANLTETVTHIFHHEAKTEICRLELFNMVTVAGDVPTIGLAFQVEITPTDAVVMFSFARNILPGVQLLANYYSALDGKVYMGVHAYVMLENDREVKATAKAVQDLKVQQIEEWEMNKLERSGKLRVH